MILSKDEKTLFANNDKNMILMWNTDLGEKIKEFEGHLGPIQ